MTVLHGVCGEDADRSAYAAVRALFGPLGLLDEEARGHPLLNGSACHALPALRPGPGDERPFTPASAYQVLHGLYRLTVNLMAHRPVALVLDDAHECDEHSLRWLDFLLRRTGDLPLLVVLARRIGPEPAVPGAWADLAGQRLTTTLCLRPMTRTDIGAMAQQVFGPAVTPAFTERVAAVSGGNPRTVTRLLHELRSDGVLPNAEGGHRATEIGGRLVARSVRELLDSQVPWVGRVATAIAVLGEDSLVHVGALAGVSIALVEDALTLLRRAKAVAPGRVDLVHDEVRRAVLEPVDPRELAELRTRAALLLSDAGRPSEEVARHLLQVPGPSEPWMLALLRDAARLADGRGAPATAARYLYRVLKAEPNDVPTRLRLAVSLAETDPFRAAALLREALEGAADLSARARFAVQYAMTCLTLHRTAAARKELDELQEAFRADPGPAARPADHELRRLMEAASLIVGSTRAGTAAASIRERATRLPAACADTPVQLQGEALTALLTALDGRSLRRAVERARGVLDASGTAPNSWPLITSAVTLGLADETADALAALDRVLAHSTEAGAVWLRALALSNRALVLHSVGAIPDALADARVAVESIAAESRCACQPMPQLALASVLIDCGEADGAEAVLARVEQPAPDGSALEYHLYLMARARARWAVGDGETALRLLFDCGSAQERAGLANPVFAPWWSDATHILAALNRTQEAERIAAHGSALARQWGSARALGLAALAHGATTPGQAGVELLTEAVEKLSGSPARTEQARAELVLGRALLTTGHPQGARAHLRIAADLARSCGALALAKEARHRLITAGGRMQEITPARADMLTGMERKVAALALQGASNRQIAASLFVTVRTVEMHLTSVYRKLGVSGRAGLASALNSTPAAGRALARVP